MVISILHNIIYLFFWIPRQEYECKDEAGKCPKSSKQWNACHKW